MNQQQILQIMRCQARGMGPSLMRGAMSLAEPAYASVVKLRNWMFESGLRRPGKLARPVISIGNLTTGGTGKTPLVSYVIRHLVEQGHRPAVLMRGYKSVDGKSDEAQELTESFGVAAEGKAKIIANPKRFQAGSQALVADPTIDVFVLDDGFQHRQLHRQLNIVLLSATDPFGLGHVLPRGLLREPIIGLKRANLIVITRSDLVDESELAKIKKRVHEAGCTAPICLARHRLTGLRSIGCSAGSKPDLPLDMLRTDKFFAFAGIGQPEALEKQLLRLAGDNLVGSRWLEDHHPYTPADYHQIVEEAASLGATHLVTTEKDFVKLPPANVTDPSPSPAGEISTSDDGMSSPSPSITQPAIPRIRLYRLGLEFEFSPEDEGRFWNAMRTLWT